KIGYTVAVIIKVAGKGDELTDFIATMLPEEAKRCSFPLPYNQAIAYEIKSNKMYPDWGGEHSHLIGIEREEPSYPGLLLEKPLTLPFEKEGETKYYLPNEQKGRFPGRIFYIILLDSCEDIYLETRDVFETMLKKSIIIE
ncbi:MAG TPA: hypothetical protein VGO09_04710, partial [Flavisolibacter sp.]|nr:hypothetical protein [Flavisolibacter sp.]